MRKLHFLLLLLFTGLAVEAQKRNFWTPVNESAIGKNAFAERERPDAFQLFRLNEAALVTELRRAPSEKAVSLRASTFTITLPNAQGQPQDFRVVEAPVMAPELSARYPDIKSYAGAGITNPASYVRLSASVLGIHAMVMAPGESTIYISPLSKKKDYYIVTARDALATQTIDFKCLTQDLQPAPNGRPNAVLKNADDGKLRQFRLAMAASGEFSQYWLNGTEADDAARRAKVLAAQNVLMTRCNGIFEKDFSARLNLVANNDAIIYLDASTDPWPGTDLNAETQTAIDAAIGDANYDIGHLVTIGGNNGKAGCIGCICNSGTKGRGFTSLAGGNWTNDQFVIDFLPHEMGHQLGGNHTFSHTDESPSIAQVEPGSGTTIMGYAGITGATTDVAAHSHDNFHAISIQQITDNLKAKGCATVSSSGNTTPTANAGADYTVPKSTPFRLTGSGSDADAGDVLSFVWEQMDVASAFGSRPSATQTNGPVFRCFPASASTSRTFPALASILDGTNGSTWEVLPSVNRTLNFRFTVRDNHAGAGANNSDDMVVTIDESNGPFAVNSPNSAVTWCPGVHTVTWSVNGSDALAANVNILLSIDGGNTFPTTLVSNTPNDGTEAVTIPCTYSTMARIKVEAVGNIFFDISNANFTVGDNTPPTFTAPGNITIFKDATCSYNAAVGVTGDVTDEADNCGTGLDATYSDVVSAGSCIGETIITRTWSLTDGCSNTAQKVQTITIKDNTPPTFTVPPNTTIYKDASCNYNAAVTITGDVTDEADNCSTGLNAVFSDVVVPGTCIGEEIITRTWSLTDNCGNKTEKIQVITARDNTPPTITSASANPPALWSPNHKMVLVTIRYTLADNCSPASAISSHLSVASNEPINGIGDGNTSPDWQVVNNHQVYLRAERAGPRNDRIYTVTIRATDDCGNEAVPVNVLVKVPHDESNVRVPGTADQPGGFGLSALPNPTTRQFTLTISGGDADAPINLRVVDLYGRTIEQRTIGSDGGTFHLGDNYRPGVYFLSLQQGQERKDIKLMKLGN